MQSNRLILRSILCVACIVFLLSGKQQASAHSLSMIQGIVTVQGDTLTVRVESNEHEGSPLARLLIRDIRGDRLLVRHSPTMREGVDDNIVKYALPSDSRYVSFQLDPPSAVSTVHVPNMVLMVRVNGEDRDAILLANGGNAEVLRIVPMSRAQTPTNVSAYTGKCASRFNEWFVSQGSDQSVRSIVVVEHSGVLIELLIPTPVIETWVPIPRANRDTIEPNERTRAITMMEAFIADRIDVRVNGSKSLTPIVKANFLDFADSQTTTNRELSRSSIWATSIRFSLQFRSPLRPHHAEIKWKLFNAVVLTARALAITPSACQEIDFSTYNAHWSWQHE